MSSPGRRSSRRFVSVAQRLLELIQLGTLQPGDRLPPDRTLSADFEVSRATVREALLALELLGVVEIRHGSGVYVADQTASVAMTADAAWFAPSTGALFEARTAIEPKLAQLCAVRLKSADIRRIDASIVKARKGVQRNSDYAAFSELQMQFHTALADGCESAILAEAARGMLSMEEHPLWALLNQQALNTPELRMQQVVEHATVLEHIKNREPDAAYAAMLQHVSDLGCALIGTDWIP